jgi:tyrosine-protein phosphatase YwqE
MAKRKTAKVKDLRPSKINDEQLAKLQGVVSAINESHANLGRLEVQKHQILHQAEQMQGAIKELQQSLEDEYGTCNISIQDGTIKYEEDEQANS